MIQPLRLCRMIQALRLCRMIKRCGFAAILLGMAVPSVAANCPNQGLLQKPVSFQTARGEFRYMVDVAASPDQQECGLMYRQQMPRDAGMIFPFSPPRSASFWMENTVLPLDLVFVSAKNRVISIGNGVPYSRNLIDSGGIAAAVIELNAGEAARIGLRPGDKVKR